MANRDSVFHGGRHEREHHAPGDQLMETGLNSKVQVFSGSPAAKAQRANLDEVDQAILARRLAEREHVPAPRIGDFVRFSDRLERISHDWAIACRQARGAAFTSAMVATHPLAEALTLRFQNSD